MTPYPALMAEREGDLAAVVLRERSRLGRFIARRVADPADAEDILQDVLQEFINAYRLPSSIEQVGAWLFRVARNRIIDRFRRKQHEPLLLDTRESATDEDDDAERLDFALPATDGGPEAEYVRAALLLALQQAIGELPDEQREVFLAHELEGRSFKQLAAQSGTAINTLLARKRYAVLHLRRRLQAVYDELEL